MATFKIPMTNDLSQQVRTTLSGKSATLHFRWNELDGFWYASLDVEGVRVSTGRRVVIGWNLFYTQLELPGAIKAIPLIFGDESEPGIAAWEATHELVYIED